MGTLLSKSMLVTVTQEKTITMLLDESDVNHPAVCAVGRCDFNSLKCNETVHWAVKIVLVKDNKLILGLDKISH